MTTKNSLFNRYLLIISIVGIIGITICLGLTLHTILDFLLRDHDSYYFKQDLLPALVWLVVFGSLFASHFPSFVRHSKTT